MYSFFRWRQVLSGEFLAPVVARQQKKHRNSFQHKHLLDLMAKKKPAV